MTRPNKVPEVSSVNRYAVLTESTIHPPEKLLSTKDAVKIYKRHMLAIGYLEKAELGDFVRSLQEEIYEHEQQLKEEVVWAKETLAEVKAEVKSEAKRIKKLLATSDEDDESESLRQDLNSGRKEVDVAADDLKGHLEALANFKKDKRSFLVNYINTEVHGNNWKEK